MPLTISASIHDLQGGEITPLVLALEGEEALDEDFRYRLTCALAGGPLAADGLLGGRVQLCIEHGDDRQQRWLGACLTGWEQLGALQLKGEVRQVYRATLEPALARQRHGLGCELWVGVSALEVAKSLLAGGEGDPAVTATDGALAVERYVSFATARPARQQVVRWRESVAALVRRLLAEEGVHTYYVHPAPVAGSSDQKGRHVLVLSQANCNANPASTQEAGGAQAISPVLAGVVLGRSGAVQRRLWSWRSAVSEGPAAIEVWEQDGSVATSHKRVGTAAANELSRLPAVPRGAWREQLGLTDLAADGTFSPGDTTVPAWLAQRRAEERVCRQRLLRGEGDHVGLQAGMLFSFGGGTGTPPRHLATRVRLAIRPAPVCSLAAPAADAGLGSALLSLAEAELQRRLAEDPLAALGGPALVAGVVCTWDGSALTGTVAVEAIPEAVPWRPAPPPAPVLAGVHPATVTGGEAGTLAVSGDGLGRIKVLLDWAGHASGWVRVAQGAAGLLALPRVGDRVAVAFQQGDPCRPLVLGTLYDSPAELPALPDQPNGSGRTVLRSRAVGRPSSLRQGRLGDLIPWDKDGDGLLATGKRGAGDDATGFGYSEIALDDRDWGGAKEDDPPHMCRGIDLFTSGGMREQVARDRTIKVGRKLVIEAGEMIELKVGDSRLVLLPGAAQVGYINPTFPAMGSHITCTHSRIEATSLALNLTGWCEASMSTAAAAFEASMTKASVTGMCATLESDLIGRLCKLVSFFFQTFGSAADPVCRVESEKASDIGLFIAKEVLMNVLSLKDVATYAGRCQGDVIGSSCLASTLGMATVSADPFSKLSTALEVLSLLGDIAGSFGEGNKDGIAAGMAGAGGVGGAIAAIVKRKEIGAKITALRAGGGEGSKWSKAKKALADMVEPPELNALRIGAVSGIRLHGLSFDEMVMRKDKTALSDTGRAAEKSDANLHQNGTSGAKSDQGLGKSDSNVGVEMTAVSQNQQKAVGTDNAVAGQGASAASSSNKAVTQDGGVFGNTTKVVESHV